MAIPSDIDPEGAEREAEEKSRSVVRKQDQTLDKECNMITDEDNEKESSPREDSPSPEGHRDTQDSVHNDSDSGNHSREALGRIWDWVDGDAVEAYDVLFDDLAIIDPISYENLRVKVSNRTKCRLSILDQERENRRENIFGSSEEPHIKVLLKLANAHLFHTPGGEAYATIFIEGRQETWPIKSKHFLSLLRHRYYLEEGELPSTQALTEAINLLEAKATYEGEVRWTRYSRHFLKTPAAQASTPRTSSG